MSRRLPVYLVILLFSIFTLKGYSQYTYPCSGSYLHFDGISGYVDAEDPLSINSGITLAAWVRCDVKNPRNMGLIFRQFYVVQGASTLTDWGIVINNSGQFMFLGEIDTTGGRTFLPEFSTQPQMDSLLSGVVPDSGVFYHVAVMLDPISYICSFYINGVIVASKTMKGGLHWASDGQGNFYDASIGSSSLNYQGNYIVPGSTFSFFNGDMADVFMSGSSLNKSQLDSIASGVNLKNSVFFYPFSEGTGTVAYSNEGVTYNSYGYGNTGTLSAGVSWQTCVAGKAVANAGPNMTITLPMKDTILNGSLSYTTGNDGPIMSYNWQQIAGPGQSNIFSPGTVSTHVNFPIKGLYTFTLQIKDQAGNTNSANVQVNVLPAWADKQDSSALVDLYNNTNGYYWFNKSGWVAGPVRNWNGVTITDDSGRVTNVLLGSNNLSGVIPSTIVNLSDLTSLNISNNKLTFDGMELLAQRFGGFASYSPQDSISIDSSQGIYNVTAGGTISNNTYSWFLNGQLDTMIFGNSTFAPKADGQYYAEVTNSVAKQLTLYSRTTNNIDTLPNFLLIDPNPSMINSDGTLNTNPANINMSAIVLGGATDGVTPILIVANSNRTITFTLADQNDGFLGPIDAATGGYTTTITPVNGKVVAEYIVPDGYGSNSSPRSRNIKITASDPNNSSITKDITIQLITPPIILVHGMWSKPAVWYEGGFIDALIAAGVQKGSIFTADYSTLSASTFDPKSSQSVVGRAAVQNAISNGINTYRSKKFAVTQVDVVGHSLGGLMTRSLSQQPSFKTQNNFNNGTIHKLITLGTPHRGSPLGPPLWDHRNDTVHLYIPLAWLALGLPPSLLSLTYTTSLNSIMSYANKPIGLCHKDFGKDSSGVKDLQSTPPFYAYAVTGNFNPSIASISAFGAMNALLICTTGKSYSDIFMAPSCAAGLSLPNSDLIVEVNSQTGGIQNTKNFLGTYHSTIIPGTNTETNSLEVQDSVISLLLTDNPTSVFSNAGFPSPQFITSDCTNGTNSVKKSKSNEAPSTLSINPEQQTHILSINNYVQITSPVHNSNYQQNSNADISLEFSIVGNIIPSNSIFIIDDIGWFTVPKQAPYSVTFKLPYNSPVGLHHVILFVKDSVAGQLYADTANILITPNGKLDSISVNPSSLYLDSAGRTSSAYVQGYFSGGQPYNISDITSASAGTTYKTQKGNAVFSVSPDGLITATKPGADTLIVSNSGYSAKLAVTVDSNFILRTIYHNEIDFPVINGHMYGDAPFYLSATAISGDDVIFSIVSGNATIVNGILIITGAGPVTVKASNQGNAYFGPAPDAYQTFCVSPGLAGAITGDTLTCAEQKKYNVSSIPGTNFQWKISEGGTINSTDSSASITWLAPGKHTIIVTPTAAGCTGTASMLNVTVNSVAKSKITPSENIQICNGANSLIQLNDSLGNIQWYLGNTPIEKATYKSLMVSQPGNYFATIIDSIGCAAISDTAVVVQVILPKPLIEPSDSTRICVGDSASLQINVSSGSLQWYDNGDSVGNKTANQIAVSRPGTYYAIETNNLGCKVNSDSVVVNVDSIASPTVEIIDSSLTCSDSLMLKSNYVSGNQWYNDSTEIGGANNQYYIATKPGEYSVRVNNGIGCSGQSTEKAITLGKIPTTPIIQSLGTQLVSSSDSGNQWYLNDTLIPAATGSSFLPVDTGKYSVQTIVNGCMSMMSAPYYYRKTVSTGPVIQIFPNPVYSYVSIINRSPNLYTIQIFDVCGKLLTNINHVSGSTQVNLSAYATGQYILLITDEISTIQVRSKLIKL